MPTLKAVNLKKSFRRRFAVNGISLDAKSGEIIALLGRNGAGKTTTFQMIAGLLKPDSGAIFLDGKDISRLPSHKRAAEGITYLPQENSVFLKTSVENNIRLILELQKNGKNDIEEKTSKFLEEMGLIHLAGQSAHSLSGGERRRLEISRSLVLYPKFLLLDEPFTGIDPLTIRELQKILLRLKNEGIGIIVSDHNVRDTLKITDRAYIIEEGKILSAGSPKEISSDEKAREKFLGKSFKLGDEVPAYSPEEKR